MKFLMIALLLVLGALGLLLMNASPETADTTGAGVDPQPSEVPADASAAVEALLDVQTAAWNRGDIPAFMGGYWKSPELRFASGGSINRGWQVTLDRYLSRYPDRAAMGTLRFEDREITVTGPDRAIAFGRWILDRENDQPQGLFTLLLRRFDLDDPDAGEYATANGWRVVADHTSSAEAAEAAE